MIFTASNKTSELPVDAYARRRDIRRVAAARLGRVDGVVAGARLAVFVAAIAIAALAFKADRLSGTWLLAPAAAFLLLLAIHDRVIKRRERAERAVRLYDEGIARVEDRAPPGDGRSRRFGDEAHPYAVDLDLFGAGSLFERLSTARTSMGEETLAAWLKAPAPPAEVRERQQAVAELAPRLDLKEELAVLGMDLGAEVNPKTLAAWAAGPELPLPPGVLGGLTGARIVSAVLGPVIAAALLAWASGRTSALPFVSAALLGTGWAIRLRALVRAVVFDADHRAAELKVVASLLARLERETFTTPLLARLGRAGARHRVRPPARALPPARRVARLAFLVDLLDARRNQLAAILTAPLLWTTQLALAVEAWRRAFGPAVDALAGGGGRRSRRSSRWRRTRSSTPSSPFPDVLDEASGPRFDGEALGHPLLPARDARRATTSRSAAARAAAADRQRLEHVGQEHAAAHRRRQRRAGAGRRAGLRAPARRCRRLAIGATLRIHDSLQEGRSRFYAEITPAAADRRPGARADPGAVPARRALERHQLPRSPRRRARRSCAGSSIAAPSGS